jgi:hypothetical protein
MVRESSGHVFILGWLHHRYSAGPVIGPPAYRANSVIGPSKGLHQVSAIMRELREAIGGFKQHKYDFGDTNGNEFIF